MPRMRQTTGLRARVTTMRVRWTRLTPRTRWATGVGATLSMALLAALAGIALRGSSAQAGAPVLTVAAANEAARGRGTATANPEASEVERRAGRAAFASQASRAVPASPSEALEVSADEERAARATERGAARPQGAPRIRFDRTRNVIEILLPEGTETKVEIKRAPTGPAADRRKRSSPPARRPRSRR